MPKRPRPAPASPDRRRGRPAAGPPPGWSPSWPPAGQVPTWRPPPRLFRRISRWKHGSCGGPLRRQKDGRLVGGVAAGLAARTGWDVTVVRTVFVLASLASGFGTVPYVVAWLLVPSVDEESNIASRALTDRRGLKLAAGLASLIVVALLLASTLNASWLGSLATPLIISAAGLVLIWRNASADEQAMLQRVAGPILGLAEGGRTPRTAWRVLLACLLGAAGVTILGFGHLHYGALLPLAGIFLVIGAIVVILGPWWLSIARDLGEERRARVRAEERADVAARVHDSVLQTLALIQRRASDPQQVIALARAQERELRSWLFDGRAPGSLDGQALTLAAGVRLIQQDVEAQYGIAIEVVIVGDCELDDGLSALLGAAREAAVNAAKWSGAPVAALFAEVEAGQVSLFVRDRGQGFDPASIPGDRKGLAESVRARMARRGGSAVIRTAPGEGTEVALTMPRAACPAPAPIAPPEKAAPPHPRPRPEPEPRDAPEPWQDVALPEDVEPQGGAGPREDAAPREDAELRDDAELTEGAAPREGAGLREDARLPEGAGVPEEAAQQHDAGLRDDAGIPEEAAPRSDPALRGDARLGDEAEPWDAPRLPDDAEMWDDAEFRDDAEPWDDAGLPDDAELRDDTDVRDDAEPWDDGEVPDEAEPWDDAELPA